MKLISVSVYNFRCYHQEITARFDDLTAFVGKNDVGKSTLLEALEIFFNNETVKIDSSDSHIHSADDMVSITCEFTDLPTSITLDATSITDLASEHLLTSAGTLKIKKTFDCGKQKVSNEVFVIAHHPTAKGVENLLELKEKDLQTLVKTESLSVPLKGNPGMRKALWAAQKDLQLATVAIPISKAKEDTKRIWEQVEPQLPMYALFQSDRKSQDSDGEVQNPMKAAVIAALSEVQPEIDAIQIKIRQKAEEIAAETHSALATLDPDLAKVLKPEFDPPTTAKWNGLFSINMTTDGVPLNKRGSGVRRLVLVSFFKAEAKRKMKKSARRSVIYAIEEPETSQHPRNQQLLIDSLKSLSEEQGCQVILTTHSPGLASELPAESIRFISRDQTHALSIDEGISVFGSIAKTLGVTPDSRVKVLLCVEGPTDVRALKCLSKILHEDDPSYIDLTTDERVAFIVLGGGTLIHWVSENYLRALSKPEFHLYDRDVPAYEVAEATVNGRNDGSFATRTMKHEIECYLHPNAVHRAFGVTIEIPDIPDTADNSVGKRFAREYTSAQGWNGVLSESKAKKFLSESAFPQLTLSELNERDLTGEVKTWFRKLEAMVNA